MQFFREKPLCLCIFVMLCGFSLFSFDHLTVSLVLGGAMLLCFLSFLIFRIVKKQAVLAIVLTVLFLLSACLSFLYFRLSRQISQEYNATLEGKIVSITEKEYGRQLTVECRSIGDKVVSDLKVSLYTSDKETPLCAMDIISTKVDIEPLYGNNTASASYSFSKGLVGSGEIVDDITVFTREREPLKEFLESIRSSFHSFIIQSFGNKGGGLFLALIIGDKDALPDECTLDFSRIGLSHMLALSGQHLSILALLIHLLLGRCGVNKKWRFGILTIFTVAYMTLTGFSPSVVRAGLMLILSCVYFLLGKPHDISTGLFISVFLFVLISPYSIMDTSLLLSAFATFGVIRAMDYTPDEKKKIPRLIRPILISLLTSFFAMLYTSILTVRKFDFISVLSPLSTLIFSLLIQIYIYAGLALSVAALSCNIMPIAEFLYKVIAVPAHFISSWGFGYYSTRFTVTQILSVVLILLILVFLILKIKHKRIFACVIGCAFVGVYLSAMIGTATAMNTNDIFYSNAEKTEQIYALDNGEVTVIDFSPYHTAGGYQTYEILQENHYPHIDNYILVGYTKSTVQSLKTLLKRTKIQNIFLASPRSAEEKEIFDQLVTLTTEATTDYYTYTEENKISLGNFEIFIVELRNEKGFAPSVCLSYYENKYTYLSNGSMRENNVTIINALLKESRALIFGKKGSACSNAISEIDTLNERVRTVIHANDAVTLNIIPTQSVDYFQCTTSHVEKKSILQ